MAKYSKIKSDLKTNKDAVKAVENSMKSEKVLTGGYKVTIQYRVKDDKVLVQLIGPHTDLRRMPDDVVIAYAAALEQRIQWINDNLEDFPVL